MNPNKKYTLLTALIVALRSFVLGFDATVISRGGAICSSKGRGAHVNIPFYVDAEAATSLTHAANSSGFNHNE